MKCCLFCNKKFKPEHWNSKFCCLEHRTKFRNEFKQAGYSIKYVSKCPVRFMSRLLLKRRYGKHQLSLKFLEELYKKQNGCCAISGVELTYQHGCGYVPTNISLDKIDPAKGYIPGNVQLVCRIVNVMKYSGSLNDLLIWCNRILINKKGELMNDEVSNEVVSEVGDIPEILKRQAEAQEAPKQDQETLADEQ